MASVFNLNGVPKVDTTVGGANVEDVARIAASAVLGIDQVNEIVKRGRLTPALVPPVGPYALSVNMQAK